MRIALFFLALMSLTAFFSCKKEERVEIPSEFPVKLIAERWELRAETRLFTDRKEIKDPEVIRRFEENENLKALFEAAILVPGEESALIFNSELTASFSFTPYFNNLYDVERKGTRFLFFSKDI